MAVVSVCIERPWCPEHGCTWMEWDPIEREWTCVFGTPLDGTPRVVGDERACEETLDGMVRSVVTLCAVNTHY